MNQEITDRNIAPFAFKRKGRSFVIQLTSEDSERQLHPETQARFNISEHSSFSRGQWDAILRDNAARLALEAAMRLLARRPHSRAEIKRKLFQRRFSAETIESTLNECERLALLDDDAFARVLIDESRQKGHGSRRILSTLLNKGVDKTLAERALADLENPDEEMENARRVFERKLASLSKENDPRRKKEKLYRHLASKGFSSEIVFRLFDECRQL